MNPYDAYLLARYLKYPEMLTGPAKQTAKQTAKQHGHLSIDQLRTIACQNTTYAYWFAFYVDKCFHHETYQACLTDTFYVSMYYTGVMEICSAEEIEGT